ncbi:hypothetical protein ACROYT_G001944 [Oculina patagonica]
MDTLKAEDKRWLVVGICLSKVLTPALRKVIARELPQLYQNLIKRTNIHSQTSASHLKCLPPSTLRLNYININNNKAQSSHHSYDYSVKDEVSLAKLFVKPYMAGFTAFDESLDSSAALSILCGAPNFVYHGIDIIAMGVRNDVRNEWGHCRFATWTEAYYLKCFQLMENLIKRLNLPVAFEAKVLDDLKKWRNRGIDMCFGQPVNNDVLKLVQEGMSTLVTSVEENKETWMQDHEGLRSNLQNLTQLFVLDIKRLEAKHVVLESGLNVLKEDQLKIKESMLKIKNEIIATSKKDKVTGFFQGMGKMTAIEKTFLRGLLWKIPVVVVLFGFLLFFFFERYFPGFMLRYWYYPRGDIQRHTLPFVYKTFETPTVDGVEFSWEAGFPGLLWKIAILILVLSGFLLFFLYERHSPGSMLRYWYCRRGSIPGHTLSFVFKTFDRQTPTVNGVEFSWENLKTKLHLNFQPINAPGVRYYLNIDRCAYGGVIAVSSFLDNTPQVRGAEVLAVNSNGTQVYYNDDGIWHPYISARNIRCQPACK